MTSKRLPKGVNSYGAEDGWIYTPGHNLHDRCYANGVRGAVSMEVKSRLYWAVLYRPVPHTRWFETGFPDHESAKGWCDLNHGSM